MPVTGCCTKVAAGARAGRAIFSSCSFSGSVSPTRHLPSSRGNKVVVAVVVAAEVLVVVVVAVVVVVVVVMVIDNNVNNR